MARLFSVALLGFLRVPDSDGRTYRLRHDVIQSALWRGGSLCMAFINGGEFDFYPSRMFVPDCAGGVQLTSFRVCGEEILSRGPVPAEIFADGLPIADSPPVEPGGVATLVFDATGDPPASAGANKGEEVAEEN